MLPTDLCSDTAIKKSTNFNLVLYITETDIISPAYLDIVPNQLIFKLCTDSICETIARTVRG
jgi:hypothetical protein